MKPQKYYDENTGEVKVGRIILYVFGVMVLISALGFGWKMITRPARTASEIVEKTFDGENVIAVYETFFNRYNEIQATGKKLKNAVQLFENTKAGLSKDPEQWNYNQRQEYDRLSQMETAFKNQLEDQVAAYNADASKKNKEIFMDRNLPQHLTSEMFIN
ncbi:MAG: hypothetical protein US30_C0006G0036 [Candidatus Moranbacteria bacterium GW2011_GWF2_36_839]|nr:MAG: hypothetical protein US27_C0006G0043 [Candidatus Moranbacteria bacterium GW2011_GWF1_36_78]KKQ17147.1 MAG: hypothetical protein US30_C0006G0036 [Candidatus Moranbacteria bacterium GW2011_GWF2_36_839]HAT74139.1 hypothetical protein [Candidatus Moranbacteria bacterium]HBY10653.1 hypothetical protein [Candidatus Moranbacteria bacterium]